MTCECKQDFFIYVPTAQDIETFSRMADAENEETAAIQVSTLFDQANENWVKIPLKGEVVVYARLPDEHHALWNDVLPWRNC